jgi:two-component system cell cycle sensor histidine kinase/response regulator CckA
VHKLLTRQIRRFFGAPETLPAELRPFVAAVEEAYRQSDTDRAMLEHSMEVVSAELGDRVRLRQALQTSQRAEEELSGALSVLSATLESTADGILVADASGKIVRMNQKFIELWGIPEYIQASGVDGLTLEFALGKLREPEQFLHKNRQINSQPEEKSFDVLHLKDGRIFERYSLPQRVRGETVGRVWSFRDVTEHRQLENLLRQAQKMESVGRLAGGVAHDFNNILTVITGRVEFLIGASNLTADQEGDLREIKTAADRAGDLTRQLLAFSRKQLLQPRLVDLNRMLDEVEPMLRRLIGEDIQIAVVRGKNLGPVRADPGQVNQVLMNLAINARDAMPSGGLLTIRTGNERGAANGNGSDRRLSGDDSVLLEVTDTGCGMDEATASQIFEPFFTTKGEGEGTGLGLATVYGIVKQSGGSISVRSAPNMGTTFRILFPFADAVDPTQLTGEEPETNETGSETILLVEDENSVRDLAQRILEMRGYKVLPARHGEDALKIASVPDNQIDLVVTDVIMPGMNGREFVEALHDQTPGVRVLYMSGYTDDDIIRRGLMDSSVAFLQKPFTAKTLARRVRSILDAK